MIDFSWEERDGGDGSLACGQWWRSDRRVGYRAQSNITTMLGSLDSVGQQRLWRPGLCATTSIDDEALLPVLCYSAMAPFLAGRTMSVMVLTLCLLLLICPANSGNPDAKRLYDDLLSNYNKIVRPVVNNSDVLTVRIKLKLSQLIDLVWLTTQKPNLECGVKKMNIAIAVDAGKKWRWRIPLGSSIYIPVEWWDLKMHCESLRVSIRIQHCKGESTPECILSCQMGTQLPKCDNIPGSRECQLSMLMAARSKSAWITPKCFLYLLLDLWDHWCVEWLPRDFSVETFIPLPYSLLFDHTSHVYTYSSRQVLWSRFILCICVRDSPSLLCGRFWLHYIKSVPRFLDGYGR